MCAAHVMMKSEKRKKKLFHSRTHDPNEESAKNGFSGRAKIIKITEKPTHDFFVCWRAEPVEKEINTHIHNRAQPK